MRKFANFVLILTFITGIALAGQVSHTLIVPTPNIDETDYGIRITLPQAMSTGKVGDPRLPVWGLNLLLPPGEEAVAVHIETGNPISLGEDYQIPPVQQQHPLSLKGPFEMNQPNADVYQTAEFYPNELVAYYRTDFYRGHGVAAISVNPVQYNPVTGELIYYPELTVKVKTERTDRSAASYQKFFKSDMSTRNALEAKIDNAYQITAYGSIQDETDEPYYDILLITNVNMVDMWDEYIDWKTKTGYQVVVETTQDIYVNYSGVDNQDKIRNCVIDYYENFNLSYVFLAADDEFIPHRGLYDNQGLYSDDDIAADWYYAALDGNWNNDNDSYWGEPGEDDLRAEVEIARAAVDSEAEIQNFVHKQMMYSLDPVVDQIETALMAGEDLGWPIWAWEYKEEVRTGSSSWGFETEPFPPNFDVQTLYETPGNYWSGITNLAPMMNEGPIYINHLGHCNTDYMMQLYTSQITTTYFNNNGIDNNYYLIYSQGCYCGAFDNRTTGGSYISDCITEAFSVMETGAVAMVTNSRYGWGDNFTTQGSSQYYDKEFFDAIWGENITNASAANTDSKEDCIPYIDFAQNRWCFYQLNLFSDPTLDLWTAEPQIIAPGYAAEIFIGSSSFQVTTPGIEGARVCLSMDGMIHGVGFTDASGQCILTMDQPIQTMGTADLWITAHNYITHQGSVLVIPPSGPYVIFGDVEIDDGDGNNNGQWDYGETVGLNLTVENVGVNDAENVTINIESDDPLVTVIGENVSFGTILQGETATVNDAFNLEVVGDVEDAHFVACTMIATDGINEWTSYFSLIVNAPDVIFDELNIDDTAGGNGNYCLDPGENADLQITVCNQGGCYTTGLEAVLTTADPYITITTSIVNYGQVLSGGLETADFSIEVSSTCPQDHTVEFVIEFSDAIGYVGQTNFTAVVGDITYDPSGPDNYGYMAYDLNDMPEFPEFEWIEISADSGGPGTRANFTQDDQVMHFALPFTFQYYGQEFDTITIASNGWIGMGVIPEDDYSNSEIPDADGPAGMIASYWEDLSPQRPNSGGVWYYYDAANDFYIVEYNHIEQYAPTGNFETYQTILYDPEYYATTTGDGRIKVQYKDMSVASASEGTIGIESPNETDGIQYCFDGDYDIHAMPLQNGMAVLYSTPGETPSLAVTTTPASLPIIIPAGGGTFQYTAEVENLGASPTTFDVWISATLPNGSDYEILARPGVTLNGGASLLRNMTQSVPASAPSGTYVYHTFAGSYASSIVWAEDSFEFEKEGTDVAGYIGDWYIEGWDDETNAMEEILPEIYSLKQNYPNPFNPLTTIQYQLPNASNVKLSVFNTLGQQVAVLVDGFQEAGFKMVAMDGKNLSSGMYFYRLEAGNFKDMKKMILIK